MNTDILQGKWKQMRGSVKAFFGKLTDDDLTTVEGNADKMLGILQERYGYTREQAQTEWEKYMRTTGSMATEAKSQVNETVEKAKTAVANAADAIKHAVR